MENEKELAKAAAVDRIVNYETYIARMNIDQLIGIINSLENLEEVAEALTELSIRDKEIAAPFCAKLLEQHLGDEFLQAVAFHLLYESDPEQAMKVVAPDLASAPSALLGAVMDSLSADSFQPFGQSLLPGVLKSIAARYSELSEADKKRILENYEWFRESYVDKLG